MASANTLYSNFIDAADVSGNIKNNKDILNYLALLATTITRIGDSKFKAVYPMVGGIAASHKLNFMNPMDSDAAFRLGYSGGLTHNANGMTGNGSTGYANTFLKNVDDITIGSTHLSFYSGTSVVNFAEMGADSVALYLNVGGNAYSDLYSASAGGRINGVVANSKGFTLGSRVSSNDHRLYKNSNQIAFSVVTSTTSENNNFTIKLLARDSVGGIVNYSTARCQFASIGLGLTPSESQVFSHNVYVAQGILGRQ